MRLTNQALIFPLLLVFNEIGGYLSNDMYLPALPTIMSDLNISKESAQLTLSAWFLGSASMQLIVGPLSDRFGRRGIVLISGILYILATCVCAWTSDITLLLFARYIQGVAVSAAIVAGYASIHELYDQIHAIRVLATMNSIIILAPAFAPLIGSLLLLFLDWRWLFWIIAIWGFVATLALAKSMPESHPIEKRHALNLKNISRNYFAMITNSRFNLLILAFCFTFSGFIAWLTAGPFIIVKEFNLSIVMFGLYQTLIFIFYMGSNQLVKYLMGKINVEKLIWMGLSITITGGVISLIACLLYPKFLSGLIIGMCIYLLGSGFSFAPLNRLAIDSCTEPMGVRMAMNSTYMTCFGVLGSVFGSVFYTGSMISLAWVLFGTSTIAILLRSMTK